MASKEEKVDTRPPDDKGLDDLEEVEEMEQGIVEEQPLQEEGDKTPAEDTNDDAHEVDNDNAPESTFHRRFRQLCLWPRVLVVGIHVIFVAVSVLMENKFAYSWADGAAGVTWFAATNQSVVQHIKMMLWPWWFILWPMDLLARKYWYGRTQTMYQRRISQSTWLSLCLAQPVAMLSAMLFIAVVYAIIYYAGSESLTPDVILFLVAVMLFSTLRLYWMGNEKVAAWWAFGYLMFGILWFYTYFSYEEDLYNGYWFDPDPHDNQNKTDRQ